MNDKLIEMAKAAGFYDTGTEMGIGCFHYFGFVDQTKELLKFAELIRKDERHSLWQPIESAPLEELVLVHTKYATQNPFVVGVFHRHNEVLTFDACTEHYEPLYDEGIGVTHSSLFPTHWQPLPEPPKEQS